jgi:zinc protease
MMKPTATLLAFTMSVSHSLSAAPTLDGAAVPLPPASKARVFTYGNGLTLIVEEDRSAPVASVQAWCGTGSIHEGRWMGAGLSHILEHMLFKGTDTRPPGEIARQVQDRGGYINAYTSFDRTVYWIDVPSDGTREALRILADVMQNATLPEEEYAKEQEVIRREFAMGFDDPGRQASQLMFSTVFNQSPFRHPVIGYLDVYNALTRDDVLDYYKARYVPNNITFVVVGDVGADAIHQELGELFSGSPRVALEPVPVATEPPQLGRREMHREFPTELSRLTMAWRIPGLTHPDTPALEVLGDILGGGRSSRLNREIRERKGIAHSASAGMFSLQDEGVFVMQAVTDPARRDEAEAESLAILDAVRNEGVGEAELDRARRSILAGQFHAMTTARGKASDLGSNWMLTRNLDFSRDYLEAISRVSSDDIRRVAAKYLTDGSINVTSLNPPGTVEAVAGEDSADADGEVRKFTLSNGLRVLVREDARLPLVSMTAVFRGGLLAEDRETNGITRLYARTLPKGTEERSAEEIADLIEGVGGSISSDSGNNSYSVTVDVMSQDFATGVDVLADVLLRPVFPEREVQLEKTTQLAGIKADEEQITSVARNLVRENLFGAHPYGLRNLGTAEAVESITRDQLMDFHKRFTVARNGVVSVFGDVKADEVVASFEKAFSSMEEGGLAFEDVEHPAPADGVVPATAHMDKKQAVLMIGYQGAAVDSPDRVALELIGEASSDLGSRFFNKIREEMGLAYFVGAAQFSGLAPGAFLFYLGTDPLKVDDVTEAMRAEIAKLAAEGLGPEEFERAKAKLLGAEAIRNQSNQAFGAVCAIDELMGLGHDAHQRRREEVEKITLDEVKQVADRYFASRAAVEAVVMPPTGAASN